LNIFKNNNYSLFSLSLNSSTALTCLTSLVIINTQPANAATTNATFNAEAVIASSCLLSAGAMNFSGYTGAEITGTTPVLVNCTNASPFTLSFSDTDHTSGLYKLVRDSTAGSATTDYLNIWFKNAALATMSNAGATITGTGIGSSATAGVITGTIPAQAGRTAGTFAKTMTVNVDY
jgi:spore coat protein U-like protein